MQTQTYQRIVLAARPKGPVEPHHFRLETVAQPTADSLKDGEVWIENEFLSLDPYMRGRMSAAKSYAEPQALDATMIGETVGVVRASKHDAFQPGDHVSGMLGWAEMGIAPGSTLRRVEIHPHFPLSAYLGVLGMPGVTAWYGVNQILQARAGQTLVVSAASGAVGSVVGQLAKLKGCKVVGIAGGEAKCRYVTEQLGVDFCVDYQSKPNDKELLQSLQTACHNGIDLLFENVGSRVFDASLACLNPYAKIALCGLVAGYNAAPLPLKNINRLLTMRASLQGFIVTEHRQVWPQALQELSDLVISEKLKFHETVTQGLTTAPQAFIGLLNGKNFGKQLVKLR